MSGQIQTRTLWVQGRGLCLNPAILLQAHGGLGRLHQSGRRLSLICLMLHIYHRRPTIFTLNRCRFLLSSLNVRLPILIALTKGIENISRQISSLDMVKVANLSVDLEELNLAYFGIAYQALITLLEKRQAKTPAADFQTPPGQTTIPANPNFSGESGSSAESKPEYFPHTFADRFIGACYLAVQRQIGGLTWMHQQCRPQLSIPYSINCLQAYVGLNKR